MQINSFPFHIGDYVRKTRGLEAIEHGMYLLLMIDLYTNKGAIEIEVDDDPMDISAPRGHGWAYGRNKRLQRICAVPDDTAFTDHLPVVLAYFNVVLLDERPGRAILTHTKVVEVLDDIQDKSDKARASANRRYRKPRNKKPNKNNDGTYANAGRTHSDGTASHKPKPYKNNKKGVLGLPSPGSPAFRLFDVLKATRGEGAPQVWASWFVDAEFTEGGEIMVSSEFKAKEINGRFEPQLRIAGFTVMSNSERATG